MVDFCRPSHIYNQTLPIMLALYVLDALATFRLALCFSYLQYYAQNYAGIISWSLGIIFRLAMIVFVHEVPLLSTFTRRVNKLTLKYIVN